MEKIWLKSYPPGIPETVNVDAYHSLVEAFETYSELFAEKTAFSNFGVRITYRQISEHSRSFAAFLQQQLRMEKSERFAILLPNLLQFPVAMLGALRAGLVVVNVNPLYTARELIHQLNDSGATGILVLDKLIGELTKALPQTSLRHVIVTTLGDCLGWMKGPIINFIVKHIRKEVPQWHITNAISFKTVLKQGRSLSLETVRLQNTDPAFLQYTGGTTGVSKGAILTHRNMIANILQCLAWFRTTLQPGQEIVLGALPLYHIFSLTVCCFCFMTIGSHCLLITDPRDTPRLIRTLQRMCPTIFVGLNTLFNGLLQQPAFATVNFSKIKLVIAGGMAMKKAVAERWQAVTHTTVIEGYGLTEASPVVSANPLSLTDYNGSIGLPLPGTEVVIRDDEGRDLAVGKTGELCVKGPQVMLGYWNHPGETTEVLCDEWLKTGDIVKMDDRGFLYLLDRKKDMIIVSGFNVYPNEVEEIIASHPGVKEVAVVGVPSEKSGEKVKAFVVKKDKTLTESALLAYCRQQLTGYKIPKEIEFRNTLPKSNVGKVLRRQLRDAAHGI
ncbi:MAG: long-chain-fatty-acid--CoA ligase [Coxiella sp. RIFCSPHIGHO2_12_FULL_44_14]|nr:MAG: long-chain-fatty-acid--CoA ligase [Coxiella sp. RIFCSPHIGHO2_12_FULL_44_14]